MTPSRHALIQGGVVLLAPFVVVLVMTSTVDAFSNMDGLANLLSSSGQSRHVDGLRDALAAASIRLHPAIAAEFKRDIGSFHESEGRYMQEAMVRPCDQVIGVVPKEALASTMTAFVDILVPPPTTEGEMDTNAFLKQSITASSQYDLVASKICSSCAQVLEMYDSDDDMFNNDEAPNSFSSYCGSDRFHYETVVSGLLLQPYDIASDSFVPGVFKGAVTGKQTNSSSFFVPTERWPEDFVVDLLGLATTPQESAMLILRNLDILLPAFAASTGTVSIMADYVGYGEDFGGTKSYGSVADYQLSTVALWLSAMKSIPEKTGGCSNLQNSASVSGFSEGAFNAVAVAAALHDLGVDVLGVFAGGGPYRTATTSKTTIASVDNGTFNPNFYVALALAGHALSSTTPDRANTDEGQDFLAEDWRDIFVGYVDEGLPTEEINAKFDPTNPLIHVNPKVVESNLVASADGFLSACTPEFAEQYPDLYLDKFCETVLNNDLTETLEKSPYPVVLCQSPEDDVVDFSNLPDLSVNDNLSMFDLFPVIGGHVSAYAVCSMATLFQYSTRPDLKTIDASDVGVCPSAFCGEDTSTEVVVPRSSGMTRIGCTDLAESADEELIGYYCRKSGKAARKCVATCGMCQPSDEACSDNDRAMKIKELDTTVTKTCGWLSMKKNAASIERLCTSFSSIRSACPETCGGCAN